MREQMPVDAIRRDRAFAYDPEFQARVAELAKRRVRPDLAVFGAKPKAPPQG
jgi:hypothetical protein